MASKCPECNQPYDFDEYKRTGKCSECGKVINNPQKYGTTRYEKATQKSANKKKPEKVEQEIIDTSQINREVKKKAVEKAKEENEKSDVPKFTPENNSKIIIDEKVEFNDADVGNDNDSSFLSEEDDEIAELRKKLEEQKRINEQLEQQERERIEQEKNIKEQRRKQANELEKQKLLKMLEEEQKKNKEISQKLQGEVLVDNSYTEPVAQKSPTKKELLQQMENRKIQESKERLFNKNKAPNDTAKMDVTSDYTEETDNLELSSPTSTDEYENSVSGETHKNAADWLKKKIEASNKKLNKDEMEMEGIEYASNIDGYYDDIPSRTPIKPDTIPKIFFLKIAGVIIGTFAFIAFLIYYA